MKELYEHNQEALNNIISNFLNVNRVALVQCTGSGKSFVFMKLVKDFFKGKKVAFIVPKWAIADNLKRYEDFAEISNQVEFFTYNYFKDDASINYIANTFDLIVADEMHHIASEIHGAGVFRCMVEAERLGKYSLGMTATNEIKNQTGYHNIGEEFFSSNVVTGLQIDEGIIRGIFPQVEYLYCVTEEVASHFKKELDIDASKLTLKETLDRNHRSKWLVYFSDIKDLQNTQRYLSEMLPNHKQFICHSKIENSLAIIDEYSAYDDECILLSVDMILEGLHVESSEGVLLFRNVVSPTVFWQVLGRLMSVGAKTSPLFIDISNSKDNITPVTEKVLTYSEEFERKHYDKKAIFKTTIQSIEQYNLLDLVQRSIIGEMQYRDISWSTNKELSLKLNQKPRFVDKHLACGQSYYQIIDSVLDKFKSYRDITWDTDVDLSIKLGMHKAYVCHRRTKGLSYESIIDSALDKVREYRGFSWINDSDLSRKLGRSTSFVNQQITKGYSHEDIIDSILDAKKHYRDIEWVDKSELAEKLGKNVHSVYALLAKGLTEEQLIDLVLNKEETRCYRDISWNTDSELCRKLGRATNYVSTYKSRGLSVEEIIDMNLDRESEYRGIKYTSSKSLDEALGKYFGFTRENKLKGLTENEIIDKVLDYTTFSYKGYTWTYDIELSEKLGYEKGYISNIKRKNPSITNEEIIDKVLAKKLKREI